MPKKKVKNIRTEEFMADDDPTVVVIEADDEGDDDGLLFKAGTYDKITVSRRGPDRYKGRPLEIGFMGNIRDEDVDEDMIARLYKGGKFRLTAFNKHHKYVGCKTIEIVGPPKEFADESPETDSRYRRVDASGGPTLRQEYLKDEIIKLREEMREAKSNKRGGLERLLDNPEGLASLLTAVMPIIRPQQEDHRLVAIERQLDKLTDRRRDDSPFDTILNYLKPFQEAQLTMMQSMMEARIEAVLNTQGSNEWIGFARELFHGPWGEKLGEALEGIKKIGEQKALEAQEATPQAPSPDEIDMSQVPELPGVAGEWFSKDIVIHLVSAIQNDVTPEDFAVTALERGIVKEPFVDYLVDEWDDQGDPDAEVNKIIAQLGLPKEAYEAFQSQYVLRWLHYMFVAVVRLCEGDATEEPEPEEAAELEPDNIIQLHATTEEVADGKKEGSPGE